jgi:hypothetical protein
VRCSMAHDRLETCEMGRWQPGMPCTCVDPGVCAPPDAGRAR